ncbi:MAG: pantetheine-phosphate adenylyltransferase [Coriobacteriaceae bacterium]|nr:pantetheine-phosphate adenylyltransferase [Coriobacteriaceae bacterium]
MRTALIPGTFDPITLGHVDVIERSSQIFDRIVVGVASSPKKGGTGPLFSEEDRIAFIIDAVKHLKNVEVQTFSNLLVDFAVEVGAIAIVKGLRVVTDFEFEFQQASLNYCLNPTLETMFIMATPEHMYLSSSMVKEVASLGGRIHDWVPALVEEALLEHYRAE